ncbi:MAG: zinc metallopeptidase [Coriobacteriaceae bacterium]|nr:zinc metallopeptidase [Coriobacteriaceae bacterium]
METSYLLVFLITFFIGGASQWYVTKTLRQYSSVPSCSGWSGVQAANAMMARYGIGQLPVHRGRENEDHFDPTTNSITLDPHAYGEDSVTSVATACHEVGHACQFAEGYTMMKVRALLVPAVNFTQRTWIILVLAGVFLGMTGLAWLGIAFYAVAVLFHVVTLPVEFDASRRGLAYMQETGALQGDLAGAQKVLRACALTYVAAALISVIELMYWIQYVRE